MTGTRARHVDIAAVRGIAVGRAADPGDDAPGAGLDRDEGRVGRLAIAERIETETDEPLGLGLQSRVERRLDDEAVAPREIGTDARDLGVREGDEVVGDGRSGVGDDVDVLRPCRPCV